MNDRLIVVGVDGSEYGRRALRWALDESARTQRNVEVVIAWRPEVDMSIHSGERPGEARARAEQIMEKEKAALAEAEKDASTVTWRLVEGRPAKVLTDAAKESDLLVTGSYGHSRLRQSVLGSVSAECVRTARCPVVVVPAPPRRGEAG
ncbi:MAG: universal stress protein [Stackebrandtia sp.]